MEKIWANLKQFSYRSRVFWTQWFIERICGLFGTALISSYIKDKNMVLLEVVPKFALGNAKEVMDESKNIMENSALGGDMFGPGDPITPVDKDAK